MRKIKEEVKLFPLRMPYTIWKFLNVEAAHVEKSTNKLINEVLKKYYENRIK